MSREQIVNELHRKARVNFPRRNVVIKGIDDLWQIDLVEMIPYAKENKNFKYLLTVIDTFSKFAWAKPIKKKDAHSTTKAMKEIFQKSGRHPKNLQSDAGKEFYNKDFKNLMQKYKINHYSTYTHLKASIVERFNRTLKDKMWKKFSLQGSYKWINILSKLINEYNNSYHRTIKTQPTKITKKK